MNTPVPTLPALIDSLAADIERDFSAGDKTEARYATPGQEYPALHVSLYYSKGGTYYGPSRRGFYVSVSPYDNGYYHVSEGAQMFISPAEITRVSKKAERDARAELKAHNLYGLLENVLA